MKLLRFILFIVHLAVVVALFATLLNAVVPPKVFGLLNLLSLTFPVLVVVHLMLTLFWCFSWKKRAILFLVASFFLLNPASRWINFNQNNKEQGQIKVLTFNSKTVGVYSVNEQAVNQFIDEQNADIVFVQEYEPELRGEKVVQYPVIALKTKHKILDHKPLIDDGSNGHSFYADLEINGKIIRVVNVYLEPFYLEKSMVKPTGNLDETEQKINRLIHKLVPTFKIHQSQISQLRYAIEDSPYPVILAGDFNSVPNSWEYFQLVDHLRDAFVEVGSGSGTSFHDYKFPLRIDYIFASEQLKPVSYEVLRDIKLSDHFPVVASFNID